MNLSKNFPEWEFCKSQAAERLGINNVMASEDRENAKALCAAVLQPTRDALGIITVNSGYRNYVVNRAVGGQDTSQHLHGMAADIESPTLTNTELATWIYKNIPVWDQLILEFVNPNVPGSGWVHVSFNRKGINRKEALMINKQGKFKWRPA